MRPFASLVFALALALAPALVQDPSPSPRALQDAERVAGLAEPHARLQRLVGEWQVEFDTLVGEQRVTTRGRAVARPELGGRYLRVELSFSLLDQPVEAIWVFGFDRLHEVYTAEWRDDRSTWAVRCRGAANQAQPERLDLRGELHDASTPAGRPFRVELDLEPARVAVRISDTRRGEPVLMQSQAWTRR